MAQKFNWGAALTTLGRGLGDYAEQQRRERTAALLRQQAEADENRRREQEMADRAELFRRQDLLAEQQYGRVMPPSFTLPGGDVTTGGFGGMRFKPATELALDMYPRQKAAPLPDPTAEVVINRNGQQQILAVEPTRIPQAVAALETTLEVPVLGGVDQNGRPVYNMTPVPRPQVSAGGGGGAGRPPTALELNRSADALTEAALGPAVEKVTAAGNIFDSSMGGTAATGRDIGALTGSELRRGMWQAFRDSSATGRWPIDAPSDILVANTWRDVAPQYAEVAIPSEWTFDPGKPNTTEDERFVDERRMRRDDKKKPLEFFKEYIVPAANEAKDAGLAWQALVNSAKKYGLDPDDLKPLLDQQRFQQFFSAAQNEDIDEKVKKKFGNVGSSR